MKNAKYYLQNEPSYCSAGGFLQADADDNNRFSGKMRLNDSKSYSDETCPEFCIECGETLYCDSFLWDKFTYPGCNKCRDTNREDKFKLIARTEAKTKYLLKDCDLDQRRPPLRFVTKKNPHNPRYGDMKLYLRVQLEKRALDLYGSWQNLANTKELKEKNKEVNSERRFEKKIKRMRKEVQGSGIQIKELAHVHVFTNAEQESEQKNGKFIKTCSLCGYILHYEEL